MSDVIFNITLSAFNGILIYLLRLVLIYLWYRWVLPSTSLSLGISFIFLLMILVTQKITPLLSSEILFMSVYLYMPLVKSACSAHYSLSYFWCDVVCCPLVEYEFERCLILTYCTLKVKNVKCYICIFVQFFLSYICLSNCYHLSCTNAIVKQ